MRNLFRRRQPAHHEVDWDSRVIDVLDAEGQLTLPQLIERVPGLHFSTVVRMTNRGELTQTGEGREATFRIADSSIT